MSLYRLCFYLDQHTKYQRTKQEKLRKIIYKMGI